MGSSGGKQPSSLPPKASLLIPSSSSSPALEKLPAAAPSSTSADAAVLDARLLREAARARELAEADASAAKSEAAALREEIAALEARLAAKSTTDWVALLNAKDVPSGEILSLDEALHQPQVAVLAPIPNHDQGQELRPGHHRDAGP